MAEVNEIVYVPVPGYGEWQLYATREGNLYRRRSYKNGTEKYVKIGSKSCDGYIHICIQNNCARLQAYAHVIIARTFINNPEDKPCVDHINGDRTDNRIENLRWATISENAQNKKKLEGTTSRYYGVCWDKNNNRWKVSIRINRKKKHVGQFKDEEQAARAYDKAAREHYSEFARLNFPEN